MNATDLVTLLPEIFLLSATCALLLIDLFVSNARRGITHFLALVVLAATAALLVRDPASASSTAFGGMFIRDGVADALKLFVLAVSAAALVYAKSWLQDRNLFKGEYHVLVDFRGDQRAIAPLDSAVAATFLALRAGEALPPESAAPLVQQGLAVAA